MYPWQGHMDTRLGDTSLADYLGAPKSVRERKDTRGTPTLKAGR